MARTNQNRIRKSQASGQRESLPAPDVSPKAEAAIHLLARLIGRQIAREQFGDRGAAEAQTRKRSIDSKTPYTSMASGAEAALKPVEPAMPRRTDC